MLSQVGYMCCNSKKVRLVLIKLRHHLSSNTNWFYIKFNDIHFLLALVIRYFFGPTMLYKKSTYNLLIFIKENLSNVPNILFKSGQQVVWIASAQDNLDIT